MATDPLVEFKGTNDLPCNEDVWFAMLERGDFAVIWDANQEAIAQASARPLTLETCEVAELMRLRPALDASED